MIRPRFAFLGILLLPGGMAVASAPVNPPALFEPLPADRARVAEQSTLHRRIRAEPSSLNPLLMFTAVDAEFESLLWDRPVVLDAGMNWRLNPRVAVDYTESSDHLSAVLILRSDLRWHDGAPLTAEDVVFSWRRIMDDRVVARQARTGADQIADCVARGPHAIHFRFKNALPTNPWNTDFPIVPRHLYGPAAEADPTLAAAEESVRLNRHPVGNGPYRFVEWLDGQRVVLERWEDYTDPKPAFRHIIFHVIPDNHAALLALESGHIDETPLTPQQFARETDGARFAEAAVKLRGPGWTTYYIGWNLRGDAPLFADARVRRALGHAVNKALIIERVYFGLFTEATGVFHADSSVGGSEAAGSVFDLRIAGELLDEAGWMRDPEDGWRYREIMAGDGASRRLRAAFTLNLPQGSQTAPAVAEIFQQDLRKVGVDMTTQVLEWSVFNERNFNGNFEAYFGAWTSGPDPDDAWNLFHSTARANGRNYTGYASAAADELLARGRATFEPEARREAYRGLAEVVRTDEPYTFLVSAPTLWAFSKDMRGVENSPRGPSLVYPGVRGWWREAK